MELRTSSSATSHAGRERNVHGHPDLEEHGRDAVDGVPAVGREQVGADAAATGDVSCAITDQRRRRDGWRESSEPPPPWMKGRKRG